MENIKEEMDFCISSSLDLIWEDYLENDLTKKPKDFYVDLKKYIRWLKNQKKEILYLTKPQWKKEFKLVDFLKAYMDDVYNDYEEERRIYKKEYKDFIILCLTEYIKKNKDEENVNPFVE